jgi:MFS family permease
VTATESRVSPLTARNAVALVFALNGFCFATLASRVPDLREALGLSNGALGALLLSIAVGSMLGMPVSGHLIER